MNTNKKEEGGVRSVWALWPQAAAGFLVSAFLLFLAAWLIFSGTVDEKHGAALALASCFVGALTGAFLGARRRKTGALLVGALCGMAFFLLFFLLGFLFSFRIFPAAAAMQVFLSALLGGLAGGFLGGLKIKKRRK